MYIDERIKKEGLRRNLSPRTVKAYLYWIKEFLKFSKKDHIEIRKGDAQLFLDHMIDRKYSYSSINLAHCSICFLLSIMRKHWNLDLKFAKREKKIPVFPNRYEVKRMIEVTINRMHKLMICLLYASGVRVSELVNLKVKDFELDEGYFWVRQGKGRKDRQTLTSQSLVTEIRAWISDNNLGYNSYIFQGRNGYHISVRTVQQVVKQATKKAGILKNVHPHSFRHSFGTHYAENNKDMDSLQILMGHKNKETTEHYTHLALPRIKKFRSPYDDL